MLAPCAAGRADGEAAAPTPRRLQWCSADAVYTMGLRVSSRVCARAVRTRHYASTCMTPPRPAHPAAVCESISTLIHLSAAGCDVSVFAPDKEQAHVVDHTKGVDGGPARNIMVEAARISRGSISPLDTLTPADFDALIVPGGFGAAKNLCNHAMVAQGDAAKLVIDEHLAGALKGFAAEGKPIGLCCIAPVLAASVLKCKVRAAGARLDT
eukprot:1423414-Prymnesium_polylepis.2